MSDDFHISFKKVNKNFSPGREVLKNINLEIKKGDFVVLLGSSGSGKSTILRLIAGLDTPTDGEVTVTHKKAYDKGFVFQESHLMPWKNVTENVELPLALMGKPAPERRQKALFMLKKVGLDNAAELYPAELSGGMKMRVSLARALVAQPDLLLLDEPFAALDEQTRFQLAEDLRALWQQSAMTVVFVTHSLHEACFLAERVLALSKNPAQIAADLKIQLPETRKNSLRTDAIFVEELKKIYGALA